MKNLAELFKSLAEETRLRLLVLLQNGREYCVCDLMNALDMPQSTVSRHLAYLKKNGWLRGRSGGVWTYYSLRSDLDAFLLAQLVLVVQQIAKSDICQADRKRLELFLENKQSNRCA